MCRPDIIVRAAVRSLDKKMRTAKEKGGKFVELEEMLRNMKVRLPKHTSCQPTSACAAMHSGHEGLGGIERRELSRAEVYDLQTCVDKAGRNLSVGTTAKTAVLTISEDLTLLRDDDCHPVRWRSPVKLSISDGRLCYFDGTAALPVPAGVADWLALRVTLSMMDLPTCVYEIAVELGAKPASLQGDKNLLRTFASLADGDFEGAAVSVYSELEAEMESRAPRFSRAGTTPEDITPAFPTDVPACFDRETQRRLKTQRLVGPLPTRIINTTTGLVEDGHGSGRYAALSYCWEQVDLTTMLGPILKLVREAGIDWLWVDARCIMQNNLEDKETEVPKMGRYYGGAALTVAVVPEMQELNKLTDIQVGEYVDEESVKAWPDWRDQLKSAKWTSRMWTFQEAALSGNLAVIGSGTSCNMDTIMWASNVRDMRRDGQKVLFSRRQGTDSVCTGSGLSNWKYYYHSGYGWPRGSQTKMELGDLWDMTAGRECKERLDRIYALLGCLTGTSSLTVDYQQDEGQLVYQLAKAGVLRSEVMVGMGAATKDGMCWAPERIDGLHPLALAHAAIGGRIIMLGRRMLVRGRVMNASQLEKYCGIVSEDGKSRLVVDTGAKAEVVVLEGEATSWFGWHRTQGSAGKMRPADKAKMWWPLRLVGCSCRSGERCGGKRVDSLDSLQ